MAGAGLSTNQVPGYTYYATAVLKPASMHFSMNGLLSTYSQTAIARISTTPLIWGGHYKQNLSGLSLTNPAMQCNVVPTSPGVITPCRFNPSGHPQGAAVPATGDGYFPTPFVAAPVASYTGGQIYVRGDTSAKFARVGANGATGINSQSDPFSAYTAQGAPSATHRCRISPSAPRYMSFFRPDLEGDYNYGADVPCTN